MALKTRLALGFAAVSALILALGAAALVSLAGANHDPAERLVVAALLALALAGIGWLAVASLRAVDDRLAPVTIESTASSASPVTLDEREPVVNRNPFADRRGPNRAANVVRPAFGQPGSGGAAVAPRSADPPDDWEAF